MVFLWQIVAAGFLVALAVHFLLGHYNLRILVRGSRVSIRGPVAAAKRAAIVHFFLHDLAPVRVLWVLGRWDGKRLRLTFWGDATPAQRQRIRNFLLTTL